RISSGLNKIKGENKLYELKRTHFDLLNAKEKRYVRFRHYAVLSVSYKRSGNLPKALLYGAVAVLSSPVFFIKEAIEMRKNKNLG
ncbi:MAG: hypothetical protein IJL87_01435, partial [Clostridia bacterium]|nr:hypothetical protein [Clostridia bacterium]